MNPTDISNLDQAWREAEDLVPTLIDLCHSDLVPLLSNNPLMIDLVKMACAIVADQCRLNAQERESGAA